jgi:hypothetical protein
LASRPAMTALRGGMTALRGGRPVRARTQAASHLQGLQTPSCAH